MYICAYTHTHTHMYVKIRMILNVKWILIICDMLKMFVCLINYLRHYQVVHLLIYK